MSNSPPAFSFKHLIERRELIPFEAPTRADTPAALVSPTGDKLLLLSKRGDLATNTNRYELLLFEARAIESAKNGSEVPRRVLASFASSSNRDAIRGVVWLDGARVAFIGEQPDAPAQVYEVELASERCRALTQHPTSVVSFAINPRTGGVLFAADVSPDHPIYALDPDYFVAEGLMAEEVVTGRRFFVQDFPPSEYFYIPCAGAAETPLGVPATDSGLTPVIKISPSGTLAAV